MPTDAPSINIITTVLASIGAVLGVINTWNALERQRVILLISPSLMHIPGKEIHVVIEVLNLSSFPVTLSEIGFELQDGNKSIHIGQMTNGKQLPARLESRDEITAIFPISTLPISQIKVAFGRTSCGFKFNGDSPALKVLKSGKKITEKDVTALGTTWKN